MKDRLKRVRKESGLSQEKFGEKLGVTKTAISKMELGTYNVTDTMLKLICTEFHISEDWLRTGEGEMFIQKDDTLIERLKKEYDLDELDEKIITSYMNLPLAERKAIKKYIEALADAIGKGKNIPKEIEEESIIYNIRSMRLSDQPASAGRGTYLGPESFHTIMVQKNDLTDRALFAVPVSGNSMEPTYHDGNILLVEKTEELQEGEIGIFTLDGEGYVKKLGDGELISLNPDYAPIPMNESILLNGKVIGILENELIVER